MKLERILISSILLCEFKITIRKTIKKHKNVIYEINHWYLTKILYQFQISESATDSERKLYFTVLSKADNLFKVLYGYVNVSF